MLLGSLYVNDGAVSPTLDKVDTCLSIKISIVLLGGLETILFWIPYLMHIRTFLSHDDVKGWL